MHNNMCSSTHVDYITKFLESLTYWQRLNLYITLLTAKSDVRYEDAKSTALCEFDNIEKFHYMMEEAINSPGPKSESSQFSSLKEEIKFKDKIIDSLLKRIDSLDRK